MSADPHANGGRILRDLRLPDFRDYAVGVDAPGAGAVESTRVLGMVLRDVMADNMGTFRLFAPDENNSTRLGAVLKVTWLVHRLTYRRTSHRRMHVREALKNKLIEHRRYIRTHGEDLPEIRHWQWRASQEPQLCGSDGPIDEPAVG